MGYQDAYVDNHVDFEISGIEYEDDAVEEPDPIQFRYPAPDISVDTSGRFVKHEIIGGATVRQKVGEDPIQAQISGVCVEPTARQLDALRDAEFGTIFSSRLVGGSLDVHFASCTTSPMESGGASALTDDDGEFLYTFDLSVVEVIVGGGDTGGGAAAGGGGGFIEEL